MCTTHHLLGTKCDALAVTSMHVEGFGALTAGVHNAAMIPAPCRRNICTVKDVPHVLPNRLYCGPSIVHGPNALSLLADFQPFISTASFCLQGDLVYRAAPLSLKARVTQVPE